MVRDTLTNPQEEEISGDKAIGYDIVINACERPFYKILENAGYDDNRIGEIEEYIKVNGEEWFGYNPREEDYFDMYKEGIIDPTKVTRLALENAASVAGTLLITEAVVSKGKEKKDTAQADPSQMLLG